ncbi:hypothetical protein K458DRAFT_258504, partial [Lentithecium fluviatile CBS 122367]
KVSKTLFGLYNGSQGGIPKFIKWTSFTHAMAKIGFAVEKLQGFAGQFTPDGNTGVERGIHFHESHPTSDISYAVARHFGRRLERMYEWRGDMF